MESEFEKKLKDVQPRKLTEDEKAYVWSNIKEGIAVERYIKAHKRSRFEQFNIFKYFGAFGHAWQFKFATIAAIVVLFFGTSFATVALADHSLPGDFLYPLNRTVENVRIQLASTDHKDELRIEFASKRLEEVKKLLARANIAYSVLAEESSSTASTTDNTGSQGNTEASVASNDNTDTGTQDSTDNTDAAQTSDNTASTSNAAEPQYFTSKSLDTAVVQANNAFVIALDYLNQTRDQMISDGNDVGLIAIDAFIAELTALADNHVSDIEHSRIVIDTNPNKNQKVSVAIQTSVDDVKTKFNFNQTTNKDGDTSNRIALRTATSTSVLTTNGDRTVYDTTTNAVNNNNNSGDHDTSHGYSGYRGVPYVPPSISICYKNDSKDVKPDELAGYFKKGAKLGSCDRQNGWGHDKIEVCHNGKTISIARPASWPHLERGDTLGSCKHGDDDDNDDHQGDTTPPAISNIATSPGTTTATITWKTNEKTKTVLWYGTSSTIDTNGAHSDDTSLLTSHTKTLTGLSTSTTYYFRIDATDTSGNTATSTVQSFTTDSGADMTAPIITGITVDATATEAVAEWTTNENTTGIVWYGTTSPLILADASHVADASSGTSHGATMTGLEPDTTYHYLVVATDGSNNMSTSSESSFTTDALPDTTAPSVSGLSSNASTSSADVTFMTDEPAKSTLWYSTTSPVPIGSSSLTYPTSGYATSHVYSLPSLTPETTYYFRIEAVDSTGNSRLIPESSLTTLALPDTTAPVITNIHTDNVTSASADIVFTTDEDAIGTVWYGTSTPLIVDGDTAFEKDASAATDHTISLSGLEASTTYYFIVGAADGSNNTSTSSEISFTTL